MTLLPIIGKLFTKIIYSILYAYLASKNILNMNQFGYRNSHSTSHAINHSIGVITEQIEKLKHVIGIFIDLSKAFDTINHDILLVKLANYGIQGISPAYRELSVLGPLLFLLYINDITIIIAQTQVSLFSLQMIQTFL